jgi:hypothetical protein
MGVAPAVLRAAPLEPAGAKVSPDVTAACDRFAGLDFTAAERQQMLGAVGEQLDRLRALRTVRLENELAPAEIFDSRLPGWRPRPPLAATPSAVAPPLPHDAEATAFAPAWQQAHWIAEGHLSSRALVDLHLARVPVRAARPACIITLLADAARAEADQCDRE